MIKKVIALIFVSFFVMSGLTVLTENNQNYNISENNQINSFTISSSQSNYFNYSISQSITYSSSISSGGQTFISYNYSLYYINGSNIMQLNFINDKTSIFLTESSQPRQLEIYNNFMIIGFGSGNTGVYSLLFQIYNFYNNTLYTGHFTYDYYYLQFAIVNNEYIFSTYANGFIYNCQISFNPITLTKISTITIDGIQNQLTVSGYNNNMIFVINQDGSPYTMIQGGFYNVNDLSLNTSITNSNSFGNVYDIMDLGNIGLLDSESFYITNENTGSSTSYSYNPYDSVQGLYFSDSNCKISFIPMNLTNYQFTKLPQINNNYQEFCYNGKIVNIYLPIGSGNSIFSTSTYIINTNNNLIIVNQNYVYVYPLNTFYLNVKSYNSYNNQIKNYFLLNNIIYNGYSNSFIFSNFPEIIKPLNTSLYFYNGSDILLVPSDFTGSGSNLYYNLSIYYQAVKPISIPLYDIFTYMYPISIIGLFVGMGSFIFVIKKRGYKI